LASPSYLIEGGVFIDESGDIGLRPPYKSSHFVIGYVYCKNPDTLRIHLKHYMTRTAEFLWNFIFANTLFSNILYNISFSKPPAIYYDRRSLTIERKTQFHNYIQNKDSYYKYRGFKNFQGELPNILEASSHLEPCIWAADFGRGADDPVFCRPNNNGKTKCDCTPPQQELDQYKTYSERKIKSFHDENF
jgi:hypothetical protein